MRKEVKDIIKRAEEFKITPNDAYNYYAKFNELNEIYDGDIPKVGDILIGTISDNDRNIKDFGVFVDIINVASVGSAVGFGNEYNISALLHWKKMQKGSPFKSWHRNYSKSFSMDLTIIVEIDNIDSKGCSLKEINPYANLEYKQVKNAKDLQILQLFETKLKIYKSFEDKDFYCKNIKNKYSLHYSSLNNCFIVDSELFIPVTCTCGIFYATRNFKKALYVICQELNFRDVLHIVKSFLNDNYKNIECTYQDVEKYFQNTYRFDNSITLSDIEWFLYKEFDIITKYEYLKLYQEFNFQNIAVNLINNENNSKVLLEMKTEVEQYNENQINEANKYSQDLIKQDREKKQRELEEKQFYKRILGQKPNKILTMYKIGESTDRLTYKMSERDSHSYGRFSENEHLEEFEIYLDNESDSHYLYKDSTLYKIDENTYPYALYDDSILIYNSRRRKVEFFDYFIQCGLSPDDVLQKYGYITKGWFRQILEMSDGEERNFY